MGAKKSRKSPRAQVTLVARYRSPTAFEFVNEECFDLSTGGMFIKSGAPAPAGTLIKLECDVDGGAAKIRGVARVVWLREQTADGHPSGMGVKFVKLDPGGRSIIDEILDRVGPDTDEDGESRRSEAPPRSSPEPFVRTPSARPGTSADSDAIAASTDEPAVAAAAGKHDAVTVRPAPEVAAVVEARAAVIGVPMATTPGPAADVDVTAAQTLRHAQPSNASPHAQALSRGAAAATALEGQSGGGAQASSGRPAARELRDRLEHAKRASGAPTSRPAPRAGDSSLAPTPVRSARPWIYAAIALLAAGGVFALSNESPAPAEPAAAVEPVVQPEPAPEPLPAIAPAAPQQPALATSVAPSAPEATAQPAPEPRYVLEVVTNPVGARVAIGSHRLTAPGEIDLGTLSDALELRAEKDDYTPSGVTIDRLGFMLDEGVMRRRVVLKLNEAPKPDREPEKKRKPRREREPEPEPEPEPVAAAVEPNPAPAQDAPPVLAVKPAAETQPAPAEAAPKPAAVIVAPEPAPAPAPAAESKPATKQTPMQAAMECLGAGDNACVVKTLEGKAKSAQELELLIETFRTMGNSAKAEKYMKQYIDKYPSERRAAAYTRVLENQQAEK